MHAAMQAVPLNRPDVPIQTGSSRWGSLALPLSLFWCNPETWRVFLLHRHTADLPPTKSQSVKQHSDIFRFLGQLQEFKTWTEPNANQLQVNFFWKTTAEHRRVELSQWGGVKKHTWSARCDMFYFAQSGVTPAWFSHNKINKPEVSDSFQSDRKTI